MSVYDNMADGLRNQGMPKDRVKAKVDEAAAMLGLDAPPGRKPRQLSGGQRQRVAIPRAHIAGTSPGGCILQNLALDHPVRVGACIVNSTWTAADELMRRVQTTRKRIALSYGPRNT